MEMGRYIPGKDWYEEKRKGKENRISASFLYAAPDDPGSNRRNFLYWNYFKGQVVYGVRSPEIWKVYGYHVCNLYIVLAFYLLDDAKICPKTSAKGE